MKPPGPYVLLRRSVNDGTMSSPTPWRSPWKPVAVPAVLGLISRLFDVQAMFSLLLRRMRTKLMPQDEESGLNDSDWKGMRISATQPSSFFFARGFPDAVPVALDVR